LTITVTDSGLNLVEQVCKMLMLGSRLRLAANIWHIGTRLPILQLPQESMECMVIIRFLLFVLMVLILSGGLGGLFYWKIQQQQMQQAAMAQRTMPPVSVEASPVLLESYTPLRKGIGSLVAVNGLALKTQTSGKITQLRFESGSKVAANSLLVALDASEEQAELRALQAELTLAQLDFERDRKLSKQQSIALSTLDKSRSELEKSRAEIARLQAIIDKKQIRAPFDGKIGLRQVNLGEYVSQGQSIATLHSLDPMYVHFLLPEKDLSVIKIGLPVEVYVDAFPGEKFAATLTALDTQIDAQSRNVKLQATLSNPQHRLLPGMFAKVKVLLPVQQEVVTIPETAVNYSLYGDAVFVIAPPPDEQTPPTVQRRYITVKNAENGRVIVATGLQAGEQVVSVGGLKLRDGAQVSIKTPPNPDKENTGERTTPATD